MKLISAYMAGLLVLVALNACAASPGHKGGRYHDNAPATSTYQLRINEKGEIEVLDENGKRIRPNAKLPLDVHARKIENIQTITIVRYSGSPVYDVIEFGGQVYQFEKKHTRHPH